MPFGLFADSHAHIHGSEYRDDIDQVMDRALQSGVKTIITVGTDLETSRSADVLAHKEPSVYAAVGIHPHDASSLDASTIEKLKQLAVSSVKVVAIGETGLDFYRDKSPRDLQESCFRTMIRLAKELALPLIIHDRDAHDRVISIMEAENAGEIGGVMHCFSGDTEFAKRCIDMGFIISIPGTVTYKNNSTLHEVVREIKIENMLIETDCPYLTPLPFRGKRNEPSYIRYTAEKIAELKGLSIEDVGRITTRNTTKLFRIGNYRESASIAYKIRNSLYLNITNRCSNRCIFCPKFDDFVVKGHYLKLDHEPSTVEITTEIGDPTRFDEVVFCGYGEPLVRIDTLIEVASYVKERNGRVRINTDGQANIFHSRNVIPEIAQYVDSISISLNAADAQTYSKLCNTPYGEKGFQGVCDFIKEAVKLIPQVYASAVSYPGVEIDKVKTLAESLGAKFREREYQEVG